MSFEFHTPVAVRYNDVDNYGHVNNVAYAALLEEARIEYVEAVVGEAAAASISGLREGPGIVIANLEIDYVRPIGLDDDVVVAVRVPRVGEKSFTFEYEVQAGGEVAATGETTVVAYDRRESSSIPVPEDWRTAIESFEGL